MFCWNIHGLTEDKIHDEYTNECIANYDCVIMVETCLSSNIFISDCHTSCLNAVKKQSRKVERWNSNYNEKSL